MRLVLWAWNYFFIVPVFSIDDNEKVGKCLPGFRVPHVHQLMQNEGIWFPQYRTRDVKNKFYKCHTLYEKVMFENKPTSLVSESYYTFNGKPLMEPYSQSYTQKEKDVLVDEEYDTNTKEFQVYSYNIALNDIYRVRYVCTNHPNSVPVFPLIYIETRNSSIPYDLIKPAFRDIHVAGFKVALHNIVQKNCVRPFGYEGYDFPLM